jgi:HD-GYP domain-containing protein (c-di-GMP phosphodiesterase class II)
VTPAKAVAEMQELAGTMFDPAVVDALQRAVGRRQTLEFLATEPPPGDVEGPGASHLQRGDP